MALSPKIVFEDELFMVIDKPFGVVVNRSDSAKGETIQDWAENQEWMGNKESKSEATGEMSEVEKEFWDRGGIVHRLDKDTSGLLLIAKTPVAFEKLKEQFKQRSVVKRYLTLVHGEVAPAEGEIVAPIERSPFNRMHFGVFPGGREAKTSYKVVRVYTHNGEKLTLVEVEPKTGRTHQIRVHMKYINHPVVSDPIYGGRKNVQADQDFCPRLFLHAGYLKIADPGTGKVMEFSLPLPADLEKCVALLK